MAGTARSIDDESLFTMTTVVIAVMMPIAGSSSIGPLLLPASIAPSEWAVSLMEWLLRVKRRHENEPRLAVPAVTVHES